jgi:hypothetical protein
MCGSQYQDEQFSSANGSWLAEDVLKGNEQKAPREARARQTMPVFVLGILAKIIGLVRLPFGGTLDSNC